MTASGEGERRAVEGAAARLRHSADAVVEAAYKAGIRQDDPVWPLVGALGEMGVSLADQVEALDRSVARTIENTRSLAIAEVTMLKQANEAAAEWIRATQRQEVLLKLKADDAVQGFVATLGPQLSERLYEVTVVKERHWNRVQILTRAALASFVVAVLMLGAYSFGGRDFALGIEGREAEAAVERCRRAAQPDQGGERWCPVSALERPQAGPSFGRQRG